MDVVEASEKSRGWEGVRSIYRGPRFRRGDFPRMPSPVVRWRYRVQGSLSMTSMTLLSRKPQGYSYKIIIKRDHWV